MTLKGWKQKVSLVEQMLNYNFTKYYVLYFFYHTDTADKQIYIFLSKHWNSFLGMIWNQAEFGTREIFLFLKNKCWLNIRLNHLRWRDVFVYFSVCIRVLVSPASEALGRLLFAALHRAGRVKLSDTETWLFPPRTQQTGSSGVFVFTWNGQTLDTSC